MKWIVRRGRTTEYLWGWLSGESSYDRYSSIGYMSAAKKPAPEWGSQGGATRYVDRVQAVKDATRAGGRLVKLVPRRKAIEIVSAPGDICGGSKKCPGCRACS